LISIGNFFKSTGDDCKKTSARHLASLGAVLVRIENALITRTAGWGIPQRKKAMEAALGRSWAGDLFRTLSFLSNLLINGHIAVSFLIFGLILAAGQYDELPDN
jgi:hypothetical protein